MRALQIIAPGRAEMVEVAEPIAGPGEVIVRIEAISSCPHWDITMMDGHDIFERPGFPHYPALPGQPGHEMTGEVEGVGPGVTTFKPGEPVIACRAMGEGRLGYYAEKASVPVTDLLLRPAHLSAAETAGLEMAVCVAGSMLRLPDLRGKRLSVGGLGPAGLIAVQMARDRGAARVVGFDPIVERRELALTLGADEVIDPFGEEAARFKARPGAEIDYAIDCSGSASSVQFQMGIVGKGIAFFGVPHEPYHYTTEHWLWGLSIYGSSERTEDAAGYALERVASGAVRLGLLNSVELPLQCFAEGTALLRERRALKVLYRP